MRADESDAGLSARTGMMPPVTSRPAGQPEPGTATGDRIAPPVVWRPATQPGPLQEATVAEEEAVAAPREAAIETELPAAPSEDVDVFEDMDEPWALSAVTETEQAADVADFIPEPDLDGALEELTIEPPFAGDPEAAEGAVEAIDEIPEVEEAEEFPLAAIILPEEREPWPEETASQAAAAPASRLPIEQLAARLQAVSHKLRTSDADSVIVSLARGDRLDTLLAGLIAGYLAGSGGE